MNFPNLSDNTVRAVAQNLNIYLPAEHLKGLLNVLDAVVADAVAQAVAQIPEAAE